MEEESISYNKNEEYNTKDTKEILNNLLKKMLDHKLNKLEKKHIGESNSLKGISKISQNLIISLENYTHKVRKEIYKIRHKNDENNNKKKENQKIMNDTRNKSLLKEDSKNNINNNIETLLETSNLNDISYINKIMKRTSKSIDAKKAKELILTSELNNKEKIKKKEKNDVFTRLASKSIGNFKKFKLTITEGNIQSPYSQNSKSKNKLKKNISKKSIHNIDKDKDKDTPSRLDKKSEKEKILKLTSTPRSSKIKQKKFNQINLENTNNNSNNTLKKLKKMNSKNKLHSTTTGTKKTISSIKKEEKKNFEENENELNDISVVNKMKEIKIENVILTDEKNEKNSVNEKLLMDEEIIKNVNNDELLISNIKIDDSELNNFSLKESINLNININSDNTKKPSTEINNNSINSFNNNNTNNNIKLITPSNPDINNINISQQKENDKNKEIEKEKEKEKENIINNLISPNNIKPPLNFLENDKEINFSLINDYSQNENENINDLNKTLDLNVSGLSEHLSLEEKFETHLDEITRYLDINELCKLMLVNKECHTTIMNILISKTEITIDILEEEITKLKESNSDIDFNKEIKLQPFSFNSNSSRAISLLNNSSGINLLNLNNNKDINDKIKNEIFIIFGIFFISIGKKKEYLSLINNEQKINYINNFFNKEKSLGNLIENEIKGKIFDEQIIANLYEYSYRYINIISPNRFQRINKDFAIFVFVVKNILEYIGALEQNIKPEKEYILYKARLKNNKEILEILNKFFEKIE